VRDLARAGKLFDGQVGLGGVAEAREQERGPSERGGAVCFGLEA